MNPYPPAESAAPPVALRRRLADLRGPGVPARPLDARALAALAANPGCDRRALLDGAGVDKTALAAALGSPSAFGQSQFAIARGNSFEARVKADGGAELLRLVHRELAPHLPEPGPDTVRTPALTAAGPEGRAARTALALREAARAAADEGAWTFLDHPMVALEVAGAPAYLEPDAVVVRPDGHWTVVEIKSFPMIDGAADPAKVGAAARQAAVYVLALERVAALLPAATADPRALLVCPKDFSNLPTGAAVDVRKQRAVTQRQLGRLTRVADLADTLPTGSCFDPELPRATLERAVTALPAGYAPECLAACELAFHCRDRARAAGEPAALGRAVRGELGSLATVDAALDAAASPAPADTDADGSGEGEGETEGGPVEDPTVTALRRAARLRAEALAHVPAARTAPESRKADPCPS
ncbi:hypothetical protein ACN20G_17225 [Streptomyces sp. BI20]|uniref:hypothetical protein n=1 Tax=Streptomyces sp. BI20 TaxID=3403460 RepID=UPI003C758341